MILIIATVFIGFEETGSENLDLPKTTLLLRDQEILEPISS
jgi:hypothetical protein